MDENKLVSLIIEQIQKDREILSKSKQESCSVTLQENADHDQ